MKKKAEKKIEVKLEPGSIIELKENGKYLIIFPKDAQLRELSEALSKFFAPAKVFCLAVNEVTDIKIAELLEE